MTPPNRKNSLREPTCASIPTRFAHPQREVSLDGLTADADVRVTTTSGALVYAGRSQGGLFRWDGRDSRGRMVASGVYYFHISNADGSRGITAKVAVVR